MLAKRIIPCLDIKEGKTVKGVNFVNFRDAGDPVELGAQYSRAGADEPSRSWSSGWLPILTFLSQ